MKTHQTVVAAIGLAMLVSSAFGQIDVSDSPFPDVIARSRAIGPFDDQAPKVTLKGVITQQATHILPRNPYQYSEWP